MSFTKNLSLSLSFSLFLFVFRAVISKQRREICKRVREGDVIALESADDANGFFFWLARADGSMFKHAGERKHANGIILKRGGYYIKVRHYDRFPSTSSNTFKLSNQIVTIDAEGVICKDVNVGNVHVRRSNRSHASSRSAGSVAPIITIASDDIARLNDIPRLDKMGIS